MSPSQADNDEIEHVIASIREELAACRTDQRNAGETSARETRAGTVPLGNSHQADDTFELPAFLRRMPETAARRHEPYLEAPVRMGRGGRDAETETVRFTGAADRNSQPVPAMSQSGTVLHDGTQSLPGAAASDGIEPDATQPAAMSPDCLAAGSGVGALLAEWIGPHWMAQAMADAPPRAQANIPGGDQPDRILQAPEPPQRTVESARMLFPATSAVAETTREDNVHPAWNAPSGMPARQTMLDGAPRWFGQPLIGQLPNEHAPPQRDSVANPIARTSGDVDDATAELLRPLLRQWLGDTMVHMVEKALHAESAQDRSQN